MQTTTYIVTARPGANLRLYPSGSYPTKEPVGQISYLEEATIISDWYSVNRVGCETRYLPVLTSGAVRYLSAALVERLTHSQRAALAAEYVYQRIYDRKALHKGAVGVISLATMEELGRIDCGRAASIVLQLAGILPVGKIITHTETDGKGGTSKDTLSKAVKGTGALYSDTCTVERVNCVYAKLPSRLKQAGVVYVQDSNVCVSAGDGKIFSCNQTGKCYGTGGENVLRTGGYPFTARVLYALVPAER